MEARVNAGTDLEGLLDPEGRVWSGAPSEPVKLTGTPANLQPTQAIRNAWADQAIGAVERVEVAAAHNGEVLAFRLEWEDATENGELSDTGSFPDAAAVLLPTVPAAGVITMGAPGAAVNAWYWRADEREGGRNVVAEGLGSSRTLEDQLVRGRGVWQDGRWQVVLARSLRVESAEPLVQLEPGASIGFGVAVWEGGSGERAGIKAFSGPQWLELRLGGLPSAARRMR
jgi:DMSO reductase family type II enzyme heme b subunit